MVRRLIILFLLSFIVGSNYAQNVDICPQIESQKALRLLNEATSALKFSDKEGSVLLLEAIKIEPEFAQAYYILGHINYNKAIDALNNINQIRFLDLYFSRAEKYFLKVTEICPPHEDFLAFYYLGMFYYNIKQYDKAKANLDVFATKSGISDDRKIIALERLKNCNTYFELVNNPVDFNPVSIEGIATPNDEFLPLISPDNEIMLYTQRYNKLGMNDLVAREHEIFTLSMREDTSNNQLDIFSEGIALSYPFNDGRNQGAVSISIDNNHLFITI